MQFVRDPSTGKRVSRPNPESAWTRIDLPDLRIVDQDVWDRVQRRLGAIRAAAGADKPDRPKYWEKRRAAHILTGKVYCGCCGGTMTNVGRDYLGCNVARKQGICANVQSTRRSELEALVMDALRTRLMAPELVADFVRSFTAEWNRAAAEASAGRDGVVRELATVQRKLNGLISALADGFRAAGLQAQLDALETKRIELSGKLAAPAPAQPRLHPNIAQVYRDKVERLQEALQADSGGQAALEAVRALIDRVVLTPAAGGRGFEIELIGEIASMIRLGLAESQKGSRANGADPDLFACSVKVVAGTGIGRQLTLPAVAC